MLMALDQFVFGLDTLAFQELQRQTQWKHRRSSRINARDANQYLGPGEDTITLSGVLAPELTGDLASLVELRQMADAGAAYAMVDGAGTVYGAFIIEGLTEGQTLHYEDGVPRRVEFSISLSRTDDDKASSAPRALGDASDGDGQAFEAYA
jgi:phage protein U